MGKRNVYVDVSEDNKVFLIILIVDAQHYNLMAV